MTPTSHTKIKTNCDDCGDEFEAFDLGRWSRRRCDKCIERQQVEERAEQEELQRQAAERSEAMRIVQARIPDFWRETTFANSDPAVNKGALARCRKYAEKFNPRQSGSLYLWSEGHGRGKTHMAACIANHVLHMLKYRVRFQKAADLLLEIKHTFVDQSEGDEADLLNRVLGFGLLVLDDVGMGTVSPWRSETYWTVFDRRLEAGLPVVVTANLPLYNDKGGETLGDHIGFGAEGRLRKMCGENVIQFTGKDLR